MERSITEGVEEKCAEFGVTFAFAAVAAVSIGGGKSFREALQLTQATMRISGICPFSGLRGWPIGCLALFVARQIICKGTPTQLPMRSTKNAMHPAADADLGQTWESFTMSRFG
jgi:hypothetical protein